MYTLLTSHLHNVHTPNITSAQGTQFYHKNILYYHLPITFGIPINENDRDDGTSVSITPEKKKKTSCDVAVWI